MSKTTHIRESTVVAEGATQIIEAKEFAGLAPVEGKRRWKIRILSPGRGSSGTHVAEVMQRDGPAAWPVGTKSNIDHIGESEQWDQPAGSLKNLAGALVTTPVWEDGPHGPGMYAVLEVGSQWAAFVEEFHELLGVSIHSAAVLGEEALEDGSYPITHYLPSALNTVDLVTVPGANGRIIEAYESACATMTPVNENNKEDEVTLTKEDVASIVSEALAPLVSEVQTLKESNVPEPVADEETNVSETLTKIMESDLPEQLKLQIAKGVDDNPNLDVDKAIENLKSITDIVRESYKADEPEGKFHSADKRDYSLDGLKF